MAAESFGPKYFQDVYANSADPWNFETSPYEKEKYETTLAALTLPRYQRAFEIGCSIGVLTESLARHCGHLLAVDISEKALGIARRRCGGLNHVAFQVMQLPEDYPEGTFDLTVLSEVGYYWSVSDLETAGEKICNHMEPGGQLLLVHWTPPVPDYPLRGDDVHEHFLSRSGLKHLKGLRREKYRLDLFESLSSK